MSATSLMTAQQLFELPGDGNRTELVAGELRMMSPSGWRHGKAVANLSRLLSSYIKIRELGYSFGAETGFLIARDPDTVRAPDFAFVATENLDRGKQSDAFWPDAPDFAVEVLSPSDRPREVEEKIECWLAAGTKLVWAVDLKLQVVRSYRSGADVEVRAVGEPIDGGDVLPGFCCLVDEFFPGS